ncbi:hypothetical protein GCM10022212_15480 [Actimicrobium antarcticum]|uniref:Uncharacterized protein n=1 Tax=Actimicrobium antarcticum TaxID=1051899 RepID=A0ABP7T2P5_9BURK
MLGFAAQPTTQSRNAAAQRTGCRAAPGLAPQSTTRFSYRRPQPARRGAPQSSLTHVAFSGLNLRFGNVHDNGR